MMESVHQQTVRQLKAADAQIKKLEAEKAELAKQLLGTVRVGAAALDSGKKLEAALENVRAALADPEPKSFEEYLLGLVNGEEPVE